MFVCFSCLKKYTRTQFQPIAFPEFPLHMQTKYLHMIRILF